MQAIRRLSNPATLNRFASVRPFSTNVDTVSPSEIALFSRLSSQWWDERGDLIMLHRMNPIRMDFIRQKLAEIHMDEADSFSAQNSLHPLQGLDVLDVGCGGGLLSESLARSGANTTGIDASESNISIASLHASLDPQLSHGSHTVGKSGSLQYIHTTAESLVTDAKRFDVVCSMEVIEHVNNPSGFLRMCADLVKPGGHLFLSTVSRTPLAYALTILAAERILALVPSGTHTYAKYVKPSEMLSFFQNHRSSTDTLNGSRPWITRLYNGLPSRTEAEVRGTIYVPWEGRWRLMRRAASVIESELSTQCNYIFWVRKPRL